MKQLPVFLLLAMMLAVACNKNGLGKSMPRCMKQKISEFDKTATCGDASVKEYKFQGKNVYVFEPGSCGADMTSEVMSVDCQSLGTLGGFTGNTMINGEDFSKAELVKTVWKK